MELQWVEADHLRAPVLVAGAPDAAPAVLVPGLSDGLAPVDLPVTQALLRDAPVPMQRFHCLVVSYPERRAGAPAPGTAELAAEIACILDRLVDQPAWLFAHSMGAMVAQRLAVDRPDLVAGMVLSATCAWADDRLRTRLAEWQRAVEERDWTGFARAAIEASYTGAERSRRRLLLRLNTPMSHPDERVARHRMLTTAACGHDARDRLPAIGCPTLVLAGERDPLCPPERGRELAAAIPGAEFEVFLGLAHGFPEQAPARFARRVLGFLAANERPGTAPDATTK